MATRVSIETERKLLTPIMIDVTIATIAKFLQIALIGVVYKGENGNRCYRF